MLYDNFLHVSRTYPHLGRLPEEPERAKREHPALLRSNHRVEKLAETICSRRDLRQDLLEKAARTLRPGDAFVETCRRHSCFFE